MFNTLERMIEDIYKDNGFLYNENLIHNIAEYIEMYNANKDDAESTYTPNTWFRETRLEMPENFVTREQLFESIADYFVKQRRLCVDQTGCLPCYEDWAQEMESDEYKQTIGEWADTVTPTDFLNWLLDTYVDSVVLCR